MGRAYPTIVRRKILSAYQRGFATAQIATMFSVSRSWVRRVKQRYREHGEVEARPMGGARRIKIDRPRLAQLVREQPDATLAELCERIEVACSPSGIENALKSLDLTFKKKRSTRPNRIVRTLPNGASNGVRGRVMSMRND